MSDRIAPPLTDAELDSRRGGDRPTAVNADTMARVNEALRWHEQRQRQRQREAESDAPRHS